VLTRQRLLLLTLVLLLSGFALAVYIRGTALSVSPASLVGIIGTATAPAILDVRFGFEFAKGHIPGALSMPLHVLLFGYEDLMIAFDKPIVVYCGTGVRACIASFLLQLVGFEQVYILEGHLSGWEHAGFPLAS
jgi:rhodanese-related sulfurtransferase